MYPIKKYVGVILIVTSFLLTTGKLFGQEVYANFNRDSSKTITLIEFKHRVDKATKLLKTQKLSAILDSDHINIMMCLNTVGMTQIRINGRFKARFVEARYKKLAMIADKRKYSRNIIKVYPQWVPNRGMGYYFPKLKMELYGTPMSYAVFNVVE